MTIENRARQVCFHIWRSDSEKVRQDRTLKALQAERDAALDKAKMVCFDMSTHAVGCDKLLKTAAKRINALKGESK